MFLQTYKTNTLIARILLLKKLIQIETIKLKMTQPRVRNFNF